MSDELVNTGKILIYQNEKGDTKIDVYFEEDTIWMTQKAMCELYQVAKSSVSEHISNIFKDGELEPEATVRKFRTVQTEGTRQVTRERDYYNLDMILAVGYRVRSNVGMHFRRWASSVLTEYMKKGFVLNDERLRNPREFGADYFDELLERIRDIRASEKRVYQKVKEIFALSVDYDSKSEVAQNFFKSVQNKLEYAATGHTAPEIIVARADASKDNMGLTSFKGAKVRRGDVTVAKNYMTHDEISTLNLIVNMYLDYAELQAKGHNPMHMADWENKLEDFLRFNGQGVLKNLGTVRREVAEKLALEQYEKFDAHRRALEAADDVDELTAGVKRLKQ
ncbi:virulence RhuM family protein [Anaerotignum lactatifermentans]|uniref:virulence RhuM family protein n=1 Tax=Anaerotignum lactatifermentans TaxID=160404 RepID=UPI0026741B06|nr:virulence RhuM family protein [Anaerotignum lactatifermentans]